MITRNSAGGVLSAGYITKLQSKDPELVYRFRFDGSAYDSYVDSISNFATRGNLGTAEILITLTNTDQQWMNFIQTEGELTKAGVIDLYHFGDSEYMPIFTGLVMAAEYSDEGKVSLRLRDRFALLLDAGIGSISSPVDYSDTGRTPAEIVWKILTEEVGLDSTETSNNPDIDYDLWNFWQAWCATAGLSFKAYIFGNSARSTIREVLRLSNSMGWISNEGKIAFDAMPAGTVPDDTWTQEHILRTAPGVHVDFIVNDQTTRFGWDRASGTWEGFVSGSDATSQSNYGTHAIVEASALVWHDTAASATAGQGFVDDLYDGKYVTSRITVPWYGYRTQVGDIVDITDADYSFTNYYFKVFELSDINMDKYTITVNGLLKTW
jgi:hypothetical protein